MVKLRYPKEASKVNPLRKIPSLKTKDRNLRNVDFASGREPRTLVRGGSTHYTFLGFLIPVIFFFFVLGFSQLSEVFQYNPDEGLSLMRGFLHAQGYRLYKEIWMDQPPFLTLLLSGLIKIFGPSVAYARILILIFSTLLLWGLFQIISKTQNFLSALLTVGLVVLSSSYVKLSVSVMVGLPAITLAILSSYGLLLYQTNYKKRYLLLSGCLLALALQTKLFVIVFLPALICEIVITERGRLEKERLIGRCLSSLLYWCIALAAVYLCFSFIISSIDFSQIIQPYVKIRSKEILSGLHEYLNDYQGYPVIQKWILQEYDIALLALGAFIFLRRKEKKFFCVPFVSFILAIFVFSTHFPIWDHHRLLVLVPMCWLASFSFYKLFSKKTWSGWPPIFFLSFALVLTAARIPAKYSGMAREMKLPQIKEYRHLIQLMEQNREQTHFVVTDQPIFAFYANLPVHPHLMLCSWRSMTAGLLTEQDFLDIIQKEQPELLLFSRFPWLQDRIVPHLDEEVYELEYHNPHNSIRLYVLKKIKRDGL